MYCVKCKKKTESKNIIQNFVTKNNRSMLKGVCTICGSNKCTFVSMKSGKGMNDIINNLPIELHMYSDKGEDVPNGSFNDQQKYSYCGPGTRYEQRINEGYKGINELDMACQCHDKFYNENKDTKSRNISDLALAHRAEEIARSINIDDQQRKDANFIAGIMKNKARFGLGIRSYTNTKLHNTKNSKN